MTAIWAFVKLMWKPPALIAIGLAVLFALRHYGDVRYKAGYHQAVSEDAVALAESQKRYDAQVKANADREVFWKGQLATERANLAVERAQPVARVVCKRANSPGPVPAGANLSAGQAGSTGDVPREAARDTESSFDPTDALIALADRADEILADCRALHSAVHGFPSAP